jgi:hypothetical protein
VTYPLSSVRRKALSSFLPTHLHRLHAFLSLSNLSPLMSAPQTLRRSFSTLDVNSLSATALLLLSGSVLLLRGLVLSLASQLCRQLFLSLLLSHFDAQWPLSLLFTKKKEHVTQQTRTPAPLIDLT